MLTAPRTAAGLAAAALLVVVCATDAVPAGAEPRTPTFSLEQENRNLRTSLKKLNDENRKLQRRLRKMKEALDVDKQVLVERNEALERLLAERERLVDAKASEAYARGRLEMAGELVEKLEIRGVPSRRERWIGADHYYSFEIWYDNRRVVHVPVETRSAESPRSMLMSSVMNVAGLLGGL